jgi:hypothetical protein
MLTALLGKSSHRAQGTKRWTGTFPEFVDGMLKSVPVATDKSASGWACGADFKDNYRNGSNLIARHFLSLDFDHIKPEDVKRILDVHRWNHAFLAYTTWSHTLEHPRIRVWVPLSRPVSALEYEAISRQVVARTGIELADPKSWDPTQFMYRPCQQDSVPFQQWKDVDAPFLDADTVLGTYADPTDPSQWPHRKDEEVRAKGTGADPRAKPGIIGAFCRKFSIAEAIDEFGLPYSRVSDDRYTYTEGSKPGGLVIYNDDTKAHAHDATDPAHGQHNSFDLVRIHRYRHLDMPADLKLSIEKRPSHKAMVRAALDIAPPAGEWENLDEART